jgi:hypothetical protein
LRFFKQIGPVDGWLVVVVISLIPVHLEFDIAKTVHRILGPTANDVAFHSKCANFVLR